MKVSWSKKAGDAVVQTSVYILDKFGPKASEEFLQEVQMCRIYWKAILVLAQLSLCWLKSQSHTEALS